MRILFIGNSHTYVNDLPLFVKQILDANEMPCEVTMLSHPGMGLDYHLDQPEMRFNILHGNYDFIVLQHDAHPFRGEEILVSCVKQIYEIISQTKSKALLYMTWSEKCNPEGQSAMAKAYRAAARSINSNVAPVGIAWQLFRSSDNSTDLYGEDGEHACEKGTILAAYTIAASISRDDREIRPRSPDEASLCKVALEAVLMET